MVTMSAPWCKPWFSDWLKFIKDYGHTPLLVTFGGSRASDEVREPLKKERIEYIHIPAIHLKQSIPLIYRYFNVDATVSAEFFWISTLFFRMASAGNFYTRTSENHLEGVLKNHIGFLKFAVKIANSAFTRNIVRVKSTKECWEKLGLKNVIVNPLGVNVDLFSYSKNVLSDELKILYVGRIAPEKGLDYLLKAVSLLDFPYSLTLLGRGEIDWYRRLAQKLGCNATFLGQTEYRKLPQEYAKHNVFVLPSITTPYWKEQFGMVLLEAMASGRIVVGSDSGAIPEVVGEAGFIVPEKTVEPLKKTLSKIYKDENVFKFMPKKARQKVEKYFDLRKNTEMLIKMIESDFKG